MNEPTTLHLTAAVSREGDWCVARRMEIQAASEGYGSTPRHEASRAACSAGGTSSLRVRRPPPTRVRSGGFGDRR
jgi:hypothetical protein